MQINTLLQLSVGADLSRTPPIYRPLGSCDGVRIMRLQIRTNSGVSIMSKPSLTGREQQQSSPSGLGHKQAKKQKNTAQMRHSCTLFDVISIFV